MFAKIFPYMEEGKRVRITSPSPAPSPCFLPRKELENKQVLELDEFTLLPLPLPHRGESSENCRARPNIHIKHSPDALRGFVGEYVGTVLEDGNS